jgi:hypothetical protein
MSGAVCWRRSRSIGGVEKHPTGPTLCSRTPAARVRVGDLFEASSRDARFGCDLLASNREVSAVCGRLAALRAPSL